MHRCLVIWRLETLRCGEDVGRIGGELVVTRGENWGGEEDDYVGE